MFPRWDEQRGRRERDRDDRDRDRDRNRDRDRGRQERTGSRDPLRENEAQPLETGCCGLRTLLNWDSGPPDSAQAGRGL